jgi:hypothetical protein
MREMRAKGNHKMVEDPYGAWRQRDLDKRQAAYGVAPEPPKATKSKRKRAPKSPTVRSPGAPRRAESASGDVELPEVLSPSEISPEGKQARGEEVGGGVGSSRSPRKGRERRLPPRSL